MSVHTYGQCGSLPCPGDSTRDCLRALNSRGYDFILVLEPHLCHNYQSDMLTKVLQHTTMVPVVFGGVDYSSQWPELEGAPVLIDALQNQSPEALARYLRHLHEHPKLLDRYREWRRDYVLESQHWQCRLCRELRNPEFPAKGERNVGNVTMKRPLCTKWPSLNFGGGR